MLLCRMPDDCDPFTNPRLMTASEKSALKQGLAAMVVFKRTFGCDLSKDKLAEVYAASLLNLTNLHGNNQGFDATAENGDRYRIKYRAQTTQHLDVNNFDFDYMVVVHMDEGYRVSGLYRATQQQAREIFARREKWSKWQATQRRFLKVAKRL